MATWRKETLNLKVGDFIIWQDEPIETQDGPAFVTPGMKGKVISLHDGAHLDVVQGGDVFLRTRTLPRPTQSSRQPN